MRGLLSLTLVIACAAVVAAVPDCETSYQTCLKSASRTFNVCVLNKKTAWKIHLMNLCSYRKEQCNSSDVTLAPMRSCNPFLSTFPIRYTTQPAKFQTLSYDTHTNSPPSWFTNPQTIPPTRRPGSTQRPGTPWWLNRTTLRYYSTGRHVTASTYHPGSTQRPGTPWWLNRTTLRYHTTGRPAPSTYRPPTTRVPFKASTTPKPSRSTSIGQMTTIYSLTRCRTIICPEFYDPVCGTDGRTYSNVCKLSVRSCYTYGRVSVKHSGQCAVEA